MTIKSKIMEALDITFEDLRDETLIDILIECYERKCKQIKTLEHANDAEKIDLHNQQDAIITELHRMRNDPTYNKAGTYYFYDANLKFAVTIYGSQVHMTVRKNNLVDYACVPMKEEEYEK